MPAALRGRARLLPCRSRRDGRCAPQHAFTLSAPTVIGAKRVFKLGMESHADAQRWHVAILGALRALGPAELGTEAKELGPTPSGSGDDDCPLAAAEQPRTPERRPEGRPGPSPEEQAPPRWRLPGWRLVVVAAAPAPVVWQPWAEEPRACRHQQQLIGRREIGLPGCGQGAGARVSSTELAACCRLWLRATSCPGSRSPAAPGLPPARLAAAPLPACSHAAAVAPDTRAARLADRVVPAMAQLGVCCTGPTPLQRLSEQEPASVQAWATHRHVNGIAVFHVGCPAGGLRPACAASLAQLSRQRLPAASSVCACSAQSFMHGLSAAPAAAEQPLCKPQA